MEKVSKDSVYKVLKARGIINGSQHFIFIFLDNKPHQSNLICVIAL